MIYNRHVRRGDRFGGVAIATAAIQNVVRRSRAEFRPAWLDETGRNGGSTAWLTG
jgi:hypothetical protein